MTSRKRFLFFMGLFLGIGLIFAVIKVAGLAGALHESIEFPWQNLAPVLSLSLLYYLLKALRWHYLLTVVGIRLPLRRSILTYLAGQWFAFSPAGEFVRAYLLVPFGYSFTRTSAVVSMQVILDLLSLAIVASVAVAWFRDLALLVLPFTVIMAAIVLALRYGSHLTGAKWFPLTPFSRIAAWKPWSSFFETSLKLLTGKTLLLGSALGITVTLIGALILYRISLDYEVSITPGESVYIYAISQLVGALSMLPHGLGAVEGSSVALFHLAGEDAVHAAAAIILFRLCTLGWGLFLGAASLLSLRTPLAGPPIPKINQIELAGDQFTETDS